MLTMLFAWTMAVPVWSLLSLPVLVVALESPSSLFMALLAL